MSARSSEWLGALAGAAVSIVPVQSPPIDPAAPFTPTVSSILNQLLPEKGPSLEQLRNAARLLSGTDGSNPSCHNQAQAALQEQTSPRVAPLCFTDGLGINVMAGPNINRTTGLPSNLMLAASFDLDLANAAGQLHGREGRELMVTGLLGPQADTAVFVNWFRGLHTFGEDPWLNGLMSTAEINGMQGMGLMAQVKHFAAYNGAADGKAVTVQDQALHEVLLLPYEIAIRDGGAASVMCSYARFRDAWACEQPLTLNYVLRELWGANAAFVGSDYGAVHSARGILAGQDREDPTANYFGSSDPPAGGIIGDGCPATGCGVVNAVARGVLPLRVMRQSLARVLYQEERFGLLGCDQTHTDCANPGGVHGDRSGLAPLSDETRNTDAAIAEKIAEEGAVLLKNEHDALPITAHDLSRGIAVSGGGAEYLIANPTNEGALGFAERNAINPLQQLQLLSGRPGAFVYVPANAPTGQPVSCKLLSPVSEASAQCGLKMQDGRLDASLDHTSSRQLKGGTRYEWNGWIRVPQSDEYVFRIQHSADVSVSFSLDGAENTLSPATSFYFGQYYGAQEVDTDSTRKGYIEAGLRNMQCDSPAQTRKKRWFDTPPPGAPPLPAESKPVRKIVACDPSPAVGWHAIHISVDVGRLTAAQKFSFRFAVSRRHGDIRDAALAAKGRALALVFVNDHDRNTIDPQPSDTGYAVSTLASDQVELIEAVAAANENTVVLLNTGTPVVVRPWIDNPHVRAVLNLWHGGQEGGTAAARLLLGQASPSGHTTITWPRESTDTIDAYDQKEGLYEGDTPGKHPERINGLPNGDTAFTQGIFSGYRYYDRLRIPVQFPFGYGLAYTTFRFSNPRATALADGGCRVEFDVVNTGKRDGTAVPQVYVGAGPALPGIQQATRALRGFARVDLRAGELQHVEVKLDARAFQYWDEKLRGWQTNSGPRQLFIGDADAPDHLPLSIEWPAMRSAAAPAPMSAQSTRR